MGGLEGSGERCSGLANHLRWVQKIGQLKSEDECVYGKEKGKGERGREVIYILRGERVTQWSV